MMNQSEKSWRDTWVNAPAATLMLSALPTDLRIKYFAQLCNFVRLVYERENAEHALTEFEGNLVDLEEYLREKISIGEISQDEADNRRGNFIRDESLKATVDAALSITRWEIPHNQLPEGNGSNSEAFDAYKERVERELIDKLRQYVNIDEA